ncbi:DJ-1 domain InhA-type [Penicillium argentinense]|uniref:DJ-1 domain InhA-type n=1 Tax=Penicillium argentinense TaxID=1131581 RepID=A0A9W9K1F9_9EURO|nr:DJ-1 domain InhA-type [Penicillium argentinense]KAJ5089161.1 DJ-1 domain InhA-type [Penicillium argentinense]
MTSIHVGILVYDYQAIDVVGPIDLLQSANSGFLEVSKIFGPINDDAISRAPDFVFHHVGITKEPFHLFTSALTLIPTTSVDECPDLDIILLGGPNPEGFKLHPKYIDFIRRHASAGKLLFTVCTGSAVLASTGLLDGKNATINHAGYKWAKENYPAVNWTKEKNGSPTKISGLELVLLREWIWLHIGSRRNSDWRFLHMLPAIWITSLEALMVSQL